MQFFSIPAGKLRRYFSLRNLTDIFKIIAGLIKSIYLIIWLKPKVVFCKGGYVSLPVGIAAFLTGTKLIIHESDLSPGLTTRILSIVADKICLSFAQSQKFFQKKHKLEITGNPIREAIFKGKRRQAWRFLSWSPKGKPLLLIMGGSSGAESLNLVVSDILGELCQFCRVVHITGKNTIIPRKKLRRDHYQRFEYLDRELADIYSITDIAISRAGAGAISELLAIKIPTIFVPLPASGSRGDQIENAETITGDRCGLLFDQEKEGAHNLLVKTIGILPGTKGFSSLKKAIAVHKHNGALARSRIADIICKYL